VASERASGDLRQWRVRDKPCVWERPLRRADLEALVVEAWLAGAAEAYLAERRQVEAPPRSSHAR